MTKINLGSGPHAAVDWINFDYGLLPFLSKFRLTKMASFFGLIDKSYVIKWPKFKYFDIRRGLPYVGDSVDYIYCSNVLEHFEKFEALKILKECDRILKKGGIVRFVLPDLTKLIELYADAESFNREFYGYDKDLFFGFWGKIKAYFIRGHQWMYDKNSFKKMLIDAGFTKISVKKFRVGKCPDINILDLEMHKRLCFYYECKK